MSRARTGWFLVLLWFGSVGSAWAQAFEFTAPQVVVIPPGQKFPIGIVLGLID